MMRELWIFIFGVLFYPAMATVTAVMTEVSGDIRGWMARRHQAPPPAMLSVAQVDALFHAVKTLGLPERMALKGLMVERRIMEDN